MRQFVFLIVVVFPLVAVSAASEQRSRRQPNRPPSIESFTSSQRIVPICPFFSTVTAYARPEVTLLVVATDPDVDSLHYEYSTTEGTISGVGKSVLWNLEGLPRGEHTVHVTVSDGKGERVVSDLTVTTVDASVCDRPPPPCPVVKVS